MDTSYLTQQVATIIAQLHGLFDEIGVPNHERDSRESELFSALSEALHDHLRQVTKEKHELTEEANRLITNIKQMEASLDDSRGSHRYGDEELQVAYPLMDCLRNLKEKHNAVSKLHRERFEQVKKLAIALESYAAHLEPSFVKIKLPPTSPSATISPSFDISPSYVTSLDNEFTRVYDEYTRRVATVQAIAEEIIKLWAELGTPQAQTDSAIIEYSRDSPEQLGLHQEDLAGLRARRDRLLDEKKGRERRIKELRTMIEGLWDRLGVDEQERKSFLAKNRGCGLRTINEFEDELSRLNELKRQNLHLFVEDARYKLQELWDGLYLSEDEMLDFAPAFSDVYSDALLAAHEAEIARLESLKEQRAPTLHLVDKHRSLLKDKEDLAASSQDASRLTSRGQKGEKRDPTRLLREEKMRKRIAKELPKVEEQLKKALEKWEDEYGRPFLVRGRRYVDEIHAASVHSKQVPPRSKTPSNASMPPPSTKPARPTTSHSRTGSVRGPPASRPKTPAPSLGRSFARNALASSVSVASSHPSPDRQKSPSRIPARVPLNSNPHLNNSPERRYDTMRKMGPPRAPPPKMKDLFVPPPVSTPGNTYEPENDASVSIVRHVPPEDVYDDRSHMSFLQSSIRATYQQPAPPFNPISIPPPVPCPGSGLTSRDSSRQTSQTSQTSSTANTMTSGSENWETYDDNSEPEPDATEMYYAKLRAARSKRFTPEGGYERLGGQGKKFKGIRNVNASELAAMEAGNGQLIKVSGSEAGWTDEDGY